MKRFKFVGMSWGTIETIKKENNQTTKSKGQCQFELEIYVTIF